jgi:hypothetical protein
MGQVAPRLGIAKLASSETRETGVSPVLLVFDLASRLRERPGAGADGGQGIHREDAKAAKFGYYQAGWFRDPGHGRLARAFGFGWGIPARECPLSRAMA